MYLWPFGCSLSNPSLVTFCPARKPLMMSRRVIVTALDVRENPSLLHCDNLSLSQHITKITSISRFTLNSELKNCHFPIISLLKFHFKSISLNSVASLGKYWDLPQNKVTVVLNMGRWTFTKSSRLISIICEV